MAYVFEEDDEWTPLVIDNGSGSIKYGMAGEEEPKSSMTTLVGRPSRNGQVGIKRAMIFL